MLSDIWKNFELDKNLFLKFSNSLLFLYNFLKNYLLHTQNCEKVINLNIMDAAPFAKTNLLGYC